MVSSYGKGCWEHLQYAGFEDFVICQTILDPSLKILCDTLSPAAVLTPTPCRPSVASSAALTPFQSTESSTGSNALIRRTVSQRGPWLRSSTSKSSSYRVARVPARNGGERCWPRVTTCRTECLCAEQNGIIQANASSSDASENSEA